MADFADRQIGQLSGGQQQRVFLARALAQDADLYLAGRALRRRRRRHGTRHRRCAEGAEGRGQTVIAVHHDLATVAEYFDRVFLINVRRSPKGPWRRPSPPRRCAAAYGGRLAATHVDQLALAGIAGLTPFVDALLLQAGYNAALVAIGAALLGFAAGATGTFLFLRKRALVSDAIAHATLPGVGLAFIIMVALGGDGRNLLGLLLGSAISAAVGLLSHPVDRRAHPPDGGCGDRRRAGRVLRLRASCC
jgi:hypothetical protein